MQHIIYETSVVALVYVLHRDRCENDFPLVNSIFMYKYNNNMLFAWFVVSVMPLLFVAASNYTQHYLAK